MKAWFVVAMSKQALYRRHVADNAKEAVPNAQES